ncbi:MAG TPA: M56 family metallopeptidase, partial [Chitinophagaceae bacterium]|nr:M56 family metallopeptidase [Chitinophagaceae bacterium]
MGLLGQSAFLKALGWALLNSVWQMGLLWMMFLLLTACMRKMTAQMKHSLAVILLGTGFCWFAFTLAGQYLTYSEQPVIIGLTESKPETIMSYIGVISKGLELALPYLSILYIAFTVFLFFRFASQYRYTNFICTQNVHKPDASIRIYVREIAERMGIKKEIRVWLSHIVDTPMTIGFLKPIILMPIASVNGLSTQQVEAILLHELSHIRRNDYLVNLLIASVDILLFFNPFSKLFVNCIRKEREHSCDDLVMQFEYSPHDYASALLAIEQKRIMKLSLAMAATGRNNQLLLDRVKRILKLPVRQQNGNRLVPLLFSVVMIGFIAWSNPGNVIVRQILHIENPEPLAVSNETNIQKISFAPPAVAPKKKKPQPKNYTIIVSIDKKLGQEKEGNSSSEEPQFTLEQYDLVAVNNNVYAPAIIQAAHETMRDYSIAEPTTVTTSTADQAYTPFVPSSSFSYYFVQDSTKPTAASTPVTVDEKAAKESLVNALKAIDEIDWTTLEKQLKAS